VFQIATLPSPHGSTSLPSRWWQGFRDGRCPSAEIEYSGIPSPT